MLFINISSDKVQIADGKKEQFLDRNGIESTLGKTLIDRHKASPFQDILLLNGPGGFTNLRVGTLTLNLLNKLLEYQFPDPRPAIRIHSLTKFDLFSYLFQKGFLPQKGLIYIGQRDNVRLYDAQEKTFEATKLSTLSQDTSLFFDFVHGDYRGENTSHMLSFHMTDKGLEIKRNNTSSTVTIKDLGLTPQSQVAPEYMIEAVLP